VTYRREALETVAFPPARFDLVVSSLVLHYIDDYPGLVRRIAEWLAPGCHRKTLWHGPGIGAQPE